jgi:hypothetical protein
MAGAGSPVIRFGGALSASSFQRGISHSLEERALWGKLGGAGSLDGDNAASGSDDFIVGYDASVVYRLIQFAIKQPPARLITLQVCGWPCRRRCRFVLCRCCLLPLGG